MLVKEDGGQSRSVDTILQSVRYLRRQLRIESMYALHHENVALTHLHLLTARTALARYEVVTRQLHLLATEQLRKLTVEQLKVESVQRLIVVRTIGVQRCLLAVNEVVVQRDGHGTNAVAYQLYAQTLARRGLSR